MTFLEELEQQRWDDHRYYHHSTINQSLHLLSALSFLGAYVLLFQNTVWAVFLGWIVAMWARQIGHFFFEPKGYDEVNAASHEHKEAIKVGYNLRRKVILLAFWVAIPIILFVDRDFFGLVAPYSNGDEFLLTLSLLWLWLAVGGLLFRTFQLFFISGVQSGLVWLTKILTDPIHDIKLYHKAPLYVAKGMRTIEPRA